MRFFSNDARETPDDEVTTDERPDRVTSEPVAVPVQRPAPSPWAAGPAPERSADTPSGRGDQTAGPVAGRPPFHDPGPQPTAFGAGTVGGAVAASATANPLGDVRQDTDRRTDAASGVADDRTVAPGDGARPDNTRPDNTRPGDTRPEDARGSLVGDTAAVRVLGGPHADAPSSSGSPLDDDRLDDDRADNHRAAPDRVNEDRVDEDRVDAALRDGGSFGDPVVAGPDRAADDGTADDGTADDGGDRGRPGDERAGVAVVPVDAPPATDRTTTPDSDRGTPATEPATPAPADAEPATDAADRDEAPTTGAADRDEAPTTGDAAGKMPGSVPTPELGPLFADTAAHEFRDRWRDVQLRFVDDPKAAADEAVSLVDEAVDALAAGLKAQREQLTAATTDGSTSDTEQLRVRLRSYRDLLDRLLTL